jgi:type II secretory pathway pseudopilin PulG
MNYTIVYYKRKVFMKKGFTIIEFIVYISILSIAIVAMGLVSINVFSVGARTNAIQEVTHNGRFVMHKIGLTINEANSLVAPETQGQSLHLTFSDPLKDPTIFDVSDGKLRITEGSGEPIELTTSKVNVDQILFKKVADNSVKVEINISFYNPQNIPEYEFANFFTSSFFLGK